MRIADFSADGKTTPLPPPRTQPTKYSIPTIDLSKETWRRVVIARGTPTVYQGHPTTVLMADNKTLFAVWTKDHGGACGPMKKSSDAGLTWSELLPVPETWKTVKNCPCIHRLTDPQGVERLLVFAGNGLMYQSVSEDGGKTWTPMEPNGLHCVVAPITIVPISGKRLLALYHRGPGDRDKPGLIIWQSISSDGGLTWAPERKVAEREWADPCEPAVIRSPDGRQLAALMRENSRRYNSLLITSNDEGETWSKPVELPAALTGDRHMPRYTHDGGAVEAGAACAAAPHLRAPGRLVIPFRDMAAGSPTKGDFVAWVGTYDDIVNLREGQYRVRLLDSPVKGDLGYPGLELLPDGTLIATTYAVLAKGEKNSVVSVRFTMKELDEKGARLAPRQTDIFVSGTDGYHTYRIPGIVVSKKGTILAFCEARKNSRADHGDIDLALKRSFDNGKSWRPMQIVWDDGGNTIGNPCPVGDQSTGTIWLPFCRDNDQVFVTHSADDGTTWATPVQITKDVKPSGWTWYATGPGHGIQLKSGRLLIPCDHKEGNEIHSHMIYSDDHGATWKLGGSLAAKTDECAVVETADGSVYVNMRSQRGQNRRAVAWSKDGGETWSQVKLDDVLIEPTCQAGMVRFTDEKMHGKSRILFSNPASVKREMMTVRISCDEGKTWNAGKLLHPGPSAYSDLAVTPDLSICCLYERGEKSAYERITFARFSLEYVSDSLDHIR